MKRLIIGLLPPFGALITLATAAVDKTCRAQAGRGDVAPGPGRWGAEPYKNTRWWHHGAGARGPVLQGAEPRPSAGTQHHMHGPGWG